MPFAALVVSNMSPGRNFNEIAILNPLSNTFSYNSEKIN